MARRIEVEIVGDSRSLERAFNRSEKQAKQFDRTMSRSSSGMKRFANSAVTASAAVLGAGGVVYALKSTVDAAMEAQRVLGQTRNAVERQGLSWAQYSRQIEAAADATSRLSGFDDERLLGTFSNLLRSTHDVNEAFKLNALAADVARGRNIELEAAAQIVMKAHMGQIGALRRVGINLDKNATATEALDALQRSYAGSAKAYGESAAGAQDRFRVAVENLQEELGEVLLPTLTNVANETTEWLNDVENRKQLIADFSALVHGLGVSAKFAADTFKTLRKAWGDYWDALPNTFDKADTKLAGDVGGGGNFSPFGVATGGPGAGTSGGGTAGQLLRPDAFSAPILNFLEKMKTVNAKIEAAQKAAAAHRARMEQQRQRFRAGLENQWGWLEFGLEKAQATKRTGDDMRVLKKQEAWLKNRISHAGRTLELTRKLWSVRQQIADLNRAKARQGDPLAGLMQVSSKRLAQVLSAGTGIGPGGMGRLQANIASAEIQPIHTHVHLDGRQIATAVTTHQTRGAARTARQTSGFRG